MTPITVAALRLPGYKYLIRCVLMPISNSSFFCLGFLSPVLNSLAMEDKRGTMRPHSPFAEGSPSPSDSKTPSPAPSGSPPPPPGSSSEISSHRPCSPVFEQGGLSGNIPVIYFFHLQTMKVSSLTSHGTRNSPNDCLASSTVTSSDCPATAR
jgi:hypothetical protein